MDYINWQLAAILMYFLGAISMWVSLKADSDTEDAVIEVYNKAIRRSSSLPKEFKDTYRTWMEQYFEIDGELIDLMDQDSDYSRWAVNAAISVSAILWPIVSLWAMLIALFDTVPTLFHKGSSK